MPYFVSAIRAVEETLQIHVIEMLEFNWPFNGLTFFTQSLSSIRLKIVEVYKSKCKLYKSSSKKV